MMQYYIIMKLKYKAFHTSDLGFAEVNLDEEA